VTAAGVVVAVVQAALVVAGAPVLVGVVRQVRARLEGRAGAGVAQPWRDLRKLLRKERICPEHSSWVFAAAPLVLVATAGVVAGIVPFASTASALDQAGDLFAVVYLLLLGTVFLALAGLDPGTAFGGMGSSREMTVAALAEPTLLVAIFALSLPAGSSNLSAIVSATSPTPTPSPPRRRCSLPAPSPWSPWPRRAGCPSTTPPPTSN
jgi:formate hydrogenlyase subunit 4